MLFKTNNNYFLKDFNLFTIKRIPNVQWKNTRQQVSSKFPRESLINYACSYVNDTSIVSVLPSVQNPKKRDFRYFASS